MKVPGGREVGENPWRRVMADTRKLARFRGFRHYAIAGEKGRADGSVVSRIFKVQPADDSTQDRRGGSRS